MIAYEEKAEYLYMRQGGRCAISGTPLNAGKMDLDHFRVRNKGHLRERFPRLIDSLLNLRAVSNAHHVGSTSKGKGWGEYRAVMAEEFLKRHPKISKWLNEPNQKLFQGK